MLMSTLLTSLSFWCSEFCILWELRPGCLVMNNAITKHTTKATRVQIEGAVLVLYTFLLHSIHSCCILCEICYNLYWRAVSLQNREIFLKKKWVSSIPFSYKDFKTIILCLCYIGIQVASQITTKYPLSMEETLEMIWSRLPSSVGISSVSQK